MDLEDELRQAMAEHVTELSAPRTLAADAKRRHHRTVRRRTAFAVGAAGVVVAGIAMIPAYQSFRPQTVGADGHEGQKHGQRATAAVSATPAPHVEGQSGSPDIRSNGPRPSVKPKHSPGSRGLPLGAAKTLLGYLPPGLTASPCESDNVGTKVTTTCRWSGSGGWIEMRLVHDGGLNVPADLGLAPPMAKQSEVHNRPALRGGGAGVPSQVMWIERHGLGVWVEVSPSLGDRLTRIAEGVNVT
jgi:hypothetical protein